MTTQPEELHGQALLDYLLYLDIQSRLLANHAS